METNEPELAESKKPTRLAIGVQGGFDADPLSKKFETRKSYSIVILPQLVIIPWPNDNLPDKVSNRNEIVNQFLFSTLVILFYHHNIGNYCSVWNNKCRVGQ